MQPQSPYSPANNWQEDDEDEEEFEFHYFLYIKNRKMN